MRRLSVVGCSGSGKTTLSRRVADALAMPHIELDALFHQPGWTQTPRGELRRAVAEHLDGGSWVIDGNYSSQVRDLVWAEADTVVWLDLSRPRVMAAVIWRTLKRGLLRRELWNGNRESLSSLFRRAPEENIVLWAWTRWPSYRAQYEAAMADSANAHLHFIRLRTRRDIRRWLAHLEAGKEQIDGR